MAWNKEGLHSDERFYFLCPSCPIKLPSCDKVHTSEKNLLEFGVVGHICWSTSSVPIGALNWMLESQVTEVFALEKEIWSCLISYFLVSYKFLFYVESQRCLDFACMNYKQCKRNASSFVPYILEEWFQSHKRVCVGDGGGGAGYQSAHLWVGEVSPSILKAILWPKGERRAHACVVPVSPDGLGIARSADV